MADYVSYADPEEEAHRLYYWDGQQLTGQKLLETEGDYLPLDMEEIRMSFSQPTLTNPAEHFIEWRNGTLSWYNKELKKNVPVKIPFRFIVLDELSKIAGYSDADQSGYWSNEIRSIVKDELTVRTKKGVQYVGTYKNHQGMVQLPQGAKYAKSIYIAHLGGHGDLIMGNLSLTGAALTAWIEFSKTTVVGNGAVKLTGSTQGQKGTTTYQIPTFEADTLEPGEYEACMELDRKLQTYLNQYMAAAETARHERPDTEVDQSVGYVPDGEEAQYMPDPMDKVHGENPLGPTVDEQDKIKAANAKAVEDFGGEPIDLSDIPF